MTNTILATEQGYGTTESNKNKNVLELMSGSHGVRKQQQLYGNQVLASTRMRPNSITLSAVIGG